MSPVSDPAEVTHVVVAAWHCDPCEVQGRSLVTDRVECWNCGGPVTVTAQPAIPIDEFMALSHGLIPQQREPIDTSPDFV